MTATAFHPNPRAARAFTAGEDGSVAMWSLVGAESGSGKKGKKGVAADGCVKFIQDAHVRRGDGDSRRRRSVRFSPLDEIKWFARTI